MVSKSPNTREIARCEGRSSGTTLARYLQGHPRFKLAHDSRYLHVSVCGLVPARTTSPSTATVATGSFELGCRWGLLIVFHTATGPWRLLRSDAAVMPPRSHPTAASGTAERRQALRLAHKATVCSLHGHSCLSYVPVSTARRALQRVRRLPIQPVTPNVRGRLDG